MFVAVSFVILPLCVNTGDALQQETHKHRHGGFSKRVNQASVGGLCAEVKAS